MTLDTYRVALGSWGNRTWRGRGRVRGVWAASVPAPVRDPPAATLLG